MMYAGYQLGGNELLIKCSENQRTNKFWTLIYARKGSGIYSVGTSLKGLNEGDIIIFPPKIGYSFASAEVDSEYNVNVDAVFFRFDEAWLDALLKVFPVMKGSIAGVKKLRHHLSVRGPKWMKLSSLLSELADSKGLQHPMKILAVLDLISTVDDMVVVREFGDFSDITKTEKIERIDRYLRSNYLRKVSLQDVADYAGMSRTYFSLFFKNHYKQGFSDYLTRRRVEHACRMLRETSLPLSEIAAESGFATVQYFTLAFRKVMGIPPGIYRSGK